MNKKMNNNNLKTNFFHNRAIAKTSKKKIHENRITKRLVFCTPYIWKKIFLFKKNFLFKTAERKVYNRSSQIPLSFLNLSIKIYSGKRWHMRFVNKWMLGYKFGEFTWNRKLALYKAKQLKKKKKK